MDRMRFAGIAKALLCALLATFPYGGASARTPVVWVEAPGARAGAIERIAEAGGPLRWFRASIEGGGLRRLAPADSVRVDSLRARLRSVPAPHADLGWEGAPGEGELIVRIARSLRDAPEWIDPSGGPTAELAGAWSGDPDWQALRRIAGLDLVLRWEEVDEFVSLSPAQNRALRMMPPTPEHPLWRLSRAFAADKVFANAALFYGRAVGAERVFLIQELAGCFEEELLPWTDAELRAPPARGDEDGEDAAARLFFLRRVRSSGPRIYGRLDRVLQSIEAEWGGRVLLIVDASRSRDPFLAVRDPAAGSARPGAVPGVAALLEVAGWNPPSRR